MSDPHHDHRRSSRAAGLVGNVMEWYDFALFGYFAPFISDLFFPGGGGLSSLLATWGIFAGGFLMRPLGAVLFGMIGDRISRRRVLVLSVVLMVVPTFALGLIPTYAAVGVAAPILLTLVRLIQGLSVGGEFSGSVTYMVETAPANRRGWAGSWANVGSMGGMLLGSGLASLVTTLLPTPAVQSWGWRLPFLLGAALGIYAYMQVRRLHESHVTHREQTHRARSPLREALTRDRWKTIQAVLFASGYGVIFYIPLVYLPDYINRFTDMALSTAMRLNTAGTVLIMLLVPLMAWISDRWVPRRYLIAGAFAVMSGLSALLFGLLQTGTTGAVAGAQLVFAVLIAVPLGVAPALLVELFHRVDRLTGYSIAYNIGLGVVGGTTPMVVTALIEAFHTPYAPAFYLTAWAVVATVALLFMRPAMAPSDDPALARAES